MRAILYGVFFLLLLVPVYFFSKHALNKAETPPAAAPHSKREAPSPLSGEAESPVIRIEAPLMADPASPAAENMPSEIQSVFSEAQKNFQRKDYRSSARLFGEISHREPEALLGEGVSYYMLGHHDRARYLLEKYLEAGGNAKNTALAGKVLAFSYYHMDELDKSASTAARSLKEKDDPELRALHERATADLRARGYELRESTTHFSVVYDGYSAKGPLTRLILDILEDAYNKIGGDIGHYPSEPVTVVLYGRESFYEVTKKPKWSGGVFDGKIRIPMKGAEANAALLRRLLYHEYTHALVHSITENCPVWINEGLAEYFSRPPTPPTGQTVPLSALERGFSETPGLPVETAYLVSYSAVRHLVETHGLFRLRLFLERLGGGAELNRAFSDAFYTSYADFVANWGK